VSRLLRIRYGPIGLPSSVRTGRWWLLPGAEVNALRTVVGLEALPAVAPTLRLRGARPPKPGRRRGPIRTR
jgi:hypothetical protein